MCTLPACPLAEHNRQLGSAFWGFAALLAEKHPRRSETPLRFLSRLPTREHVDHSTTHCVRWGARLCRPSLATGVVGTHSRTPFLPSGEHRSRHPRVRKTPRFLSPFWHNYTQAPTDHPLEFLLVFTLS